jgi:tRNA (adenine22-N1)-methyltransferase
LAKCAEFVHGEKLVDIGSDHAKLPVWLAVNGRIKSAIAADITEFSVMRSLAIIRRFDVANVVDARISDGFANITENEANDIVIAGLGGKTIIKILDECKWRSLFQKRLILQPMKDSTALQFFLVKKGCKIIEQCLIIERSKKYTVMLAEFSSGIKR